VGPHASEGNAQTFPEHGMSRAEAKLATEKFITDWRDLSSKRIRGPVEDAAE